MKEQWRNVRGHEKRYMVSNLGRVRAIYRKRSKTLRHKDGEGVMSSPINRKGYPKLSLYGDNGKRVNYEVHALVARAFVPNPENKPCVNHIDGNKANNHVSNLEWCTWLENMEHARKTGLIKHKGEAHRNARLNRHKVKRARLLKEVSPGIKWRDLADIFGVSLSCIEAAVSRRTWKHVP
jgi:hypothetical protein